MKTLKQYIQTINEKKGDRAKLIFTIWETPEKKVTKLSSNTAYQKIECKYAEKPDDPYTLQISFLLGFKNDYWKLWAGKPGVVTYSDDPYCNLKEVEFSPALLKALDKCEELIDDIKDHPSNWPQFYDSI